MNTYTDLLPLLIGDGNQEEKTKAYNLLLERVVRTVGKKCISAEEHSEAETIAHEVLSDFLMRAKIQGWPRLENRNDAFQILSLKTMELLVDRRRLENAQKRGGGLNRHTLLDDLEDEQISSISELEIQEEVQKVLDSVPTPIHQKLLRCVFEGKNQKECAKELSVHPRTISRKLEEIRDLCLRNEDD
jgi:DNA-directed RNA polymerase specialized sigma24 family protein